MIFIPFRAQKRLKFYSYLHFLYFYQTWMSGFDTNNVQPCYYLFHQYASSPNNLINFVLCSDNPAGVGETHTTKDLFILFKLRLLIPNRQNERINECVSYFTVFRLGRPALNEVNIFYFP